MQNFAHVIHLTMGLHLRQMVIRASNRVLLRDGHNALSCQPLGGTRSGHIGSFRHGKSHEAVKCRTRNSKQS